MRAPCHDAQRPRGAAWALPPVPGCGPTESSAPTARRPRADVNRLRSVTLRFRYSTVTVLARFRGWSTSVPLKSATKYESSWSGSAVTKGERTGSTLGT